MTGEVLKSSFNNVAKLQEQFFPRKALMGTLSEAKQEEIRKGAAEDPNDGYTCYRLQPTTEEESPSTASLINGLVPPELYQVVREACAQQNVKWPVECQVLPEPINHIEDWPLYPESFYQSTGRELRPQPVGDEMGRIVYQYYPTSTVNYFTRSCVGGNKQLSRDVRPPLTDPEDTTLQFESRFESGNLAKAVQISDCYYELHIRSDLYTARHTQWFYFSISNTRKEMAYRLSIVNLCKGDSLYNHGMRPLLYSSKEAELHGVGWRRCASNIVYFRNQDSESGCFDSDDETDEEAPSFTLTFNVTFPHDHDTVFLSHCFPYTYSSLQQHLLTIQNDPIRSGVCRQRILCRSLAGNPVYLLTITGHEPEDEPKRKRAVVLSARVHPGETPSSWIMKGAIDFLTSDHPKAVELRRQFVFKVIPMVNPDGVIVGNHRCSLVGRDLNRQYKMVVKEMFPAVWHAKAMIRRLMDEHGVVMFCDFHAHSRKHNIFLYGCENRRNHENHLREQIFPLLLHYNAGDKFSFRNCKFRVQRCKEGTARVVVWMMGVLHSYTLESSFGGASEGSRSGTHFSILDFLMMGRQFSESLCEYFDAQPGKEKIRNRLWSRLVKKGSNADEPMAVDLSDSNSSSDDSDRQPPQTRGRRKKLARTIKKRPGLRSVISSLTDDRFYHSKHDKLDRRGKLAATHANGSEITSSLGHTEDSEPINAAEKYGCLSSSKIEKSSNSSSPANADPYSLSSLLKKLAMKGAEYREEQQNLSNEFKGLVDCDSSYSSKTASPKTAHRKNRRIRLKKDVQSHKNSPSLARRNYISALKSPQEARAERVCSPSNYVDHMGELMSTQLALSDNDDISSKFWSNGSSSPYWEKSPSPGSSVTRLSCLRLDARLACRLDTLEPVVAKTRLHEPRPLQRSGRSPSHPSFKAAQIVGRGACRAKMNLKHEKCSSKSKKKLNPKTLLSWGGDDDCISPRTRKGGRNSLEDDDDSRKDKLKPIKLGKSSSLKTLTKDTIKRNKETVKLMKTTLKENVSEKATDIIVTVDNCSVDNNSQDTKKMGRKSKKDDPNTLAIPSKRSDEGELCADIANCDTLFLDIGAQETPELKAARNLKGRIKKKKSSGTSSALSDQEIISSDVPSMSEPNGNVQNTVDASISTEESTNITKVKKKIKIVIGKKTKTKTGRKKSRQVSIIDE